MPNRARAFDPLPPADTVEVIVGAALSAVKGEAALEQGNRMAARLYLDELRFALERLDRDGAGGRAEVSMLRAQHERLISTLSSGVFWVGQTVLTREG